MLDDVFIVILNKQLYSIELHLMEGRYTCPECICKYFKLDRSKCFHLSALSALLRSNLFATDHTATSEQSGRSKVCKQRLSIDDIGHCKN